jgi:UDP-N-acetylglucosamine 1-carboxyvinyltransferase
MSSYIIEGGKKLEGTLDVSGSKNASLPIIAGTILSGKESKLYNVPNIHDTKITLQILEILGCKIHRKNGKIVVDSMGIRKYEIPENLMSKMRSSVVLAGALIGRFKKAIFTYPGGCDIGVRPIDLHLKGFRKLGINVTEESGLIICSTDKIIGSEIHLDFPSVGATENIILASVFAKRRNYFNK